MPLFNQCAQVMLLFLICFTGSHASADVTVNDGYLSHKEGEESKEEKENQRKDSDEPLTEIKLQNGQHLTGRLTCKEETCVLDLGGSKIELQRSEIQSYRQLDETSKAQERVEPKSEPNRTRYLYSPSAFSLKSGEGYISQKELFFTSVAYGVTDHFTLIGGAVLPAWLLGLEGMNLILGGKYSFELSDQIRLALGAEGFIFSELGITQTFIGLTYGSEVNHVTLNVGKPILFSTEGVEEFGLIMTSLSGNFRLTETFRLITENWVIFKSGVDELVHMNSLAFRIQGASLSADIGFVFAGLSGEFLPIPIPWLDIAYNF